jgi:hypothetical protein
LKPGISKEESENKKTQQSCDVFDERKCHYVEWEIVNIDGFVIELPQ